VSEKESVNSTLSCPHQPACPGCPRLGDETPPSEVWETFLTFCREFDVEQPAWKTGAKEGFRMRSRLAVRGSTQAPQVGLFARGSHDVVDIPKCLIHHPLINQVAATLKQIIRETHTSLYDERLHEGLLRYVQIVIERQTQKAQVVLVCHSETHHPAQKLASKLSVALGDVLHSLWWNGNSQTGNKILGARWHRWQGEGFVEEQIAGARVFFHPGAFGQNHLELAEEIVEQIHEWVPEKAQLLEYYAGCGAIGLGLLSKVTSCTFNEIAPASMDGLLHALSLLDDEHVQVMEGTAGEFAWLLSSEHVTIVDPPRKGLDPELLTQLLETPPQRLIYVSCGQKAFLQEARQLLESGQYTLKELQLYDLFPYTHHVETLALFEKKED